MVLVHYRAKKFHIYLFNNYVKYQTIIRRIGRAVRASLTTDSRRRSEEAGAEVEALLGADTPLHRGTWHRIKGWYKAEVEHVPPPYQVTLEQIMEERVELYSYVPSLGKNIPISVQPFPVDDSDLTEDEIEWAVVDGQTVGGRTDG